MSFLPVLKDRYRIFMGRSRLAPVGHCTFSITGIERYIPIMTQEGLIRPCRVLFSIPDDHCHRALAVTTKKSSARKAWKTLTFRTSIGEEKDINYALAPLTSLFFAEPRYKRF